MYQIPEFIKIEGLIHGFSTIKEGDMSFNFLPVGDVIKNRKNFLKKLNVELGSVVSPLQTHSDKIVEVDEKDMGKGAFDWESSPKGDALITDRKGVILLIKTADCASVVVYDPITPAVALVHAGWKGADNEIVVKTVNSLSKKYKSKRQNLIVAIGPAARKDSFIKENPSQLGDPKWQDFLEKVEGNKYKVDFVGLIKKQLEDCGVMRKNIFDCGIDTVKDKRFYSHYRDSEKTGSEGRFASVVGLISGI
jgi:polyphenol oxidase